MKKMLQSNVFFVTINYFRIFEKQSHH